MAAVMQHSRQEPFPHPASCFCRTCQWWHRCEAAFRASFCLYTCPQSPLNRWAGSCRDWWRHRRDQSTSAKKIWLRMKIKDLVMSPTISSNTKKLMLCNRFCVAKFFWSGKCLTSSWSNLAHTQLKLMTELGIIKLWPLERLGWFYLS